VVPEVNPESIWEYAPQNIIANPNCSTIQMLVALKPIQDAVGIESINVSTYQAVSGAGKSGIEALAGQTARLLNGQSIEDAPKGNVFSSQIGFNVIPHIGSFEENGYSNEEMKMVWETHKIFGDENIAVNPTCVRVPVFFGHSEAVHIRTKSPLEASDARALLENAAGVTLVDDLSNNSYPSAVVDSSGKDDVFVGRVRDDLSDPNGLNLWIVSDNVRKGAALNSIQIAEVLLKRL